MKTKFLSLALAAIFGLGLSNAQIIKEAKAETKEVKTEAKKDVKKEAKEAKKVEAKKTEHKGHNHKVHKMTK